ncbi:MAG: helix-turn-helix transcriptional regulator [Gemmatales bacterium]
MATKSQHSRTYRKLPEFLKKLREDAGLTIRELGVKLGQPHSFVYKSEFGLRRVDVTEFAEWAKACTIDPQKALGDFLKK